MGGLAYHAVMADPDLKPCFFISPIGSEGSEVRKKADQVLKHLVRPALKECGYLAQRADEIDEPGSITSQVIQRVLNDEIVVADLTGHNANVFYELAVRHAIPKPFVQIIEKGQTVPFDITDTRTVFYELSLDGIDAARADLVRKVKAALDPEINLETPIGKALSLSTMQSSENQTDKALAEALERLARIERYVEHTVDSDRDRTRGTIWSARALEEIYAIAADAFANGEPREASLEKALRGATGHEIGSLSREQLETLREGFRAYRANHDVRRKKPT